MATNDDPNVPTAPKNLRIMAKCRIVCLNCRVEFNSPIQFGDAQSFFSGSLVGNQVQCPNCRKTTACNEENMKFSTGDEGFVGEDTA